MIRFLLAAFCLSTAASPVLARSAADYYHGAAYRYVEGKLQEAGVEAEEGLRRHPGDEKLRALAEQIRKMRDEQRGNSGSDGDRDRNESEGPQDRDQGDRSQPEDPNDRPNPDEDRRAKEPPPGSGRDPDRPEGSDREERPQPGQMSREEAERLLNSFADDEKKEQAERRRAIRTRAGTEQDW